MARFLGGYSIDTKFLREVEIGERIPFTPSANPVYERQTLTDLERTIANSERIIEEIANELREGREVNAKKYESSFMSSIREIKKSKPNRKSRKTS